MNNIYFFLFSLLISSNLIAQSGFIVEETTVASFKMGSMKSSAHKYFSEDMYYSKIDFSFKGKGLARLMSRNMKNGTTISFQDSTIIKINHKKNRFTKTLLSEFLEEDSPSDKENDESEKEEDKEEEKEEDSKPIVSDTIEIVNGFESYKVTDVSGDEGSSALLWFTSEMQKSDIVTSMQIKIDKFEKDWMNFDMDGDLSELGINENAVVVKAIFSSEDGEFEYNLKRYLAIDSIPEIFHIPENYKQVKKL